MICLCWKGSCKLHHYMIQIRWWMKPTSLTKNSALCVIENLRVERLTPPALPIATMLLHRHVYPPPQQVPNWPRVPRAHHHRSNNWQRRQRRTPRIPHRTMCWLYPKLRIPRSRHHLWPRRQPSLNTKANCICIWPDQHRQILTVEPSTNSRLLRYPAPIRYWQSRWWPSQEWHPNKWNARISYRTT